MSRTNRAAGNIDKSLVTNLVTLLIIVAGFYSPVYREQILGVGFFALSGAVTNWLAVHMLFERVPLLYGSGVIPARFEEFKTAIKDLIMSQFFTEENINRVVLAEEENAAQVLDVEPLLDAIDYDTVFDRLVEAILNSSFGSMLGMIGGAKALGSLKEPFVAKIRETLAEMTRSERFTAALAASVNASKLSADIKDKVEDIVNHRLNELTPQLVKTIVQDMIKQHLGWLVVWGGVFGGVIGLLVSLLGQ